MKIFGLGSKFNYIRGSNEEFTCVGFVKIDGEWLVRAVSNDKDILFNLTDIEAILL
jgi:hypothetical protein